MKSIRSLVEAGVIAVLIAAPLAAFAQSNQADKPMTRAQVGADPANIRAAEARGASQTQAARNSGYGTPASGSSQRSGRADFVPSSYSAPVVNYTR
ncbi:hypothetical protein [Paraburkholderia sp. HP33-1]|uniref:hypothetical protein n=1 Tax=Paraburkholderia sp. HP33-1 TaxID=2883243 RepID=UPI001F21D678|nr:hypothetical protein [Paraburkholderia sp. HP33-1]